MDDVLRPSQARVRGPGLLRCFVLSAELRRSSTEDRVVDDQHDDRAGSGLGAI
jgi:hypothetical protein